MKIYSFAFLVLFFLRAACAVDKGDIFEQTQSNWDEFHKHLNWYFSYLDESVVKEQDNAYGRHLLQHKEELKKAITESKDMLFQLRKKFREIALAKHGNYPDTKEEAAAIDAELTGWYISYIKAILFPDDWKSQFEKFKAGSK